MRDWETRWLETHCLTSVWGEGHEGRTHGSRTFQRLKDTNLFREESKGLAKVNASELVIFSTAVSYHFCPSLPAGCSIHATCSIGFIRSLYNIVLWLDKQFCTMETFTNGLLLAPSSQFHAVWSWWPQHIDWIVRNSTKPIFPSCGADRWTEYPFCRTEKSCGTDTDAWEGSTSHDVVQVI